MAPSFLDQPYRQVGFLCSGCNQEWFTPAFGCPHCDTDGHPVTPAIPDPIVWTLGVVPGHPILLSAHLRDAERFQSFCRLGVQEVVDVAADPEGSYVWRPTPEQFDSARVGHNVIADVWDDNLTLPARAFDEVYELLTFADSWNRLTLLHCSAGLKRAPHLLYGFLLAEGLPPDEAWRHVQEARPMASPFEPYVRAAHYWAGVPF